MTVSPQETSNETLTDDEHAACGSVVILLVITEISHSKDILQEDILEE